MCGGVAFEVACVRLACGKGGQAKCVSVWQAVVCKDEMIEQGFKEMSEIEKTLGFAEKDWDYDTRNLQANYADDLLRIVRNKIKKYQI